MAEAGHDGEAMKVTEEMIEIARSFHIRHGGLPYNRSYVRQLLEAIVGRVCDECGEFRPDDDRPIAGMKCYFCAYPAMTDGEK